MKKYKSHSFKGQDPIVTELFIIIYETGTTKAYIERKTGVAKTTLYNWEKKKTLRPNFSTIQAVYKGLGYELRPLKVNK